MTGTDQLADRLVDAVPAADDLDAAVARFYLALGRLARALRRTGENGDLGPGTFSALATVVQYGPLRLGDLAAREGVAPPTLTRIVAALEDHGLLARETDPDDRRAVRVDATVAGREMIAGVRSARFAAIKERLAGMPEADRLLLFAALPVIEALASEDA